MPFNKKLISLRKEKNLTQQELANLLEISISYLKKCEKGVSSPTIDILRKMAKALGVSSDYLIFENGNGIADGKILDKELLELFERISKLEKEDKEPVKIILKSIIVRSEVDKLATTNKKGG